MFKDALTMGVCAVLLLTVGSPRALAIPRAGETLAEVSVTAEKKSNPEPCRRHPAAVTAIAAEDLVDQGVTDLREAQKLVPLGCASS